MAQALQITHRDGTIIRALSIEVVFVADDDDELCRLKVVDEHGRTAILDPYRIACVVVCEEQQKAKAKILPPNGVT
jgi:hypothetical protein